LGGGGEEIKKEISRTVKTLPKLDHPSPECSLEIREDSVSWWMSAWRSQAPKRKGDCKLHSKEFQ